MNLALAQLATLLDATLEKGDPDTLITGFNSLIDATSGEVSFLGNDLYKPKLRTTHASAVLVASDFTGETPPAVALLRVASPTLAFDEIIKRFGPAKTPFVPGIHPSAVIESGASVDAGASIQAHAVISNGAVIGTGTSIGAGVFVGPNTKIGRDCFIHPNVTLRENCEIGDRVVIHSGTVIGSDGFGYEFAKGRHQKIDQVGIVVIQDDVEIGACTTIDRARFGRTFIGKGTKIDNLVQIAHNVQIGQHSLIISQTGISGSSKVGNYVTIAGQVGISGHVEIADGIIIAARGGVSKNVKEKGVYWGTPVIPLHEAKEIIIHTRRLPKLAQQVKDLEAKLKALEAKLLIKE